MMTEKRMISKLKGAHGGVSTDGLSLLAKIISRHHINQLKVQNAVHSSVPRGQSGGHIKADRPVHPLVPRGQVGGQPGGQVYGHTKKEVTYDTTPPDTDPTI